MKGQSKLESILEVVIARLVGLVASFVGNYIVFNNILDMNITVSTNIFIAIFFFIWSSTYNYILRRIWNWHYLRKYK